MSDGPELDRSFATRLGEDLRFIQGEAADPQQVAARRLASSLRKLFSALIANGAPSEVLSRVTSLIDEATVELAPYPSGRRYEDITLPMERFGHDRGFFEWSPLLGLSTPLAPPIFFDVEDDVVVGRANFGIAYEGPPGCVHGGFVAAAFDELLGIAQSLSGKSGMTGTLTVRYRRPTPLYADLRLEGRADSVSGRKILTSGKILLDGVVTAEATGLFIALSPEKFAGSLNWSKPETG